MEKDDKEKGLPIYNITLEGDGGLEFVSFVDEPAILEMGLAFSHMDVEHFESYTDYPEAAKENAKIAMRWAEENGWGSCGTAVGKKRAATLSKGGAISEETIARMASFERHRQHSNKELGDGCGRLMWLAWGGDEGVEWAQRKLDQIRNDKQEYNNNEPFEFKFDKEKQIVAGPAMIPNTPIYRRDEDGYEFYVVFTTEVIEQLVEKFNKEHRDYKINLDHTPEAVESAYIKSNWIIEDEKYDKSRYYGFDNLPIGTWMLEVKVDDAEFWNKEIKAGNKHGFSVEGMFGLELTDHKFNKVNNNNNHKTIEMELSKNEIALIEKHRAELALAEATSNEEDSDEIKVEEVIVVEEVETSKEEEKEDKYVEEEEVAEEVAEGEEVAEESVEEEEAPAHVMDEAAIMEIVQPKFDEIMSLIAELKSSMEDAPVEEEVSEFKSMTVTDKIKAFKRHFN